MKYCIGGLELISGLLMLWAIIRLYSSINMKNEFEGLFNQRMIIIHLSTFVIYIISLVLYYVFYYLWVDAYKSENLYYLFWTISDLMLYIVQFVLMFILLRLSGQSIEYREFEDKQDDEGDSNESIAFLEKRRKS